MTLVAASGRTFDVLAPPDGPRVGVLLHVPHSSQIIPADVRTRLLLSDADLQRELLLMTDQHTEALFACVLERGGVALVNRLSRLVVVPERFPDDEQEPMARVGMGVVYSRTHDGRPLRYEDRAERERLLDRYFHPYAAAATGAVDALLARFGRCLILDGHSFPSRPLPCEPSHAPDRPELCVGTDETHTPETLVGAIETACRACGTTTRRNSPFAGTYVPLAFLRRDRRVSSVMIEVRRDTYMDESTGARSGAFDARRAFLGEVIDTRIHVWDTRGGGA